MKQSHKILLCVLIIILLIMSIFFRIDSVPKIKQTRSFDYTEKDAGGLLLLGELLKVSFGENNVRAVESDNFEYLESSDEDLMVLLQNRVKLDSTDVKLIKSYLMRGKNVLLSSTSFSLNDLMENYESRTAVITDTLITVHWEPDSFYYDVSNVAKSFLNVSTARYFKNPTKDFTIVDDYDHRELSRATGIAYIQDSLDIFRKYHVNGGSLYLHSMPNILTNDVSLTNIYLPNFNRTFSEIPASSIVLHQWNRRNINAGNNEDSILKYILSQPSLKYAYYLTLLGCLIYVFFSSKRKQKPIPVKEYVKNTSLDYVHTISDVFKAQNQNEKLVPHMKKVFYNRMQRKYFLSPELPDYASKLSRKSKVPIANIESLIAKFEQADNYAFDDDQLIRLYTDINSFYKSCK